MPESAAFFSLGGIAQTLDDFRCATIYGYCKKNGEIVVNEDEAVIVRRIYKEFLDGKNYDEIIAGLTADGVPTRKNATWHSRTVIGILSNEKYCGNCLFQKAFIPDPISHKTVVNCGEIPQFLVEDCIPAIIEKKQWLAAQEMRKRHQGVSKPPVKALPFRSLVFCGTCGKPCPQYSSHSEGRRLTAYYRCISWRDYTAVEVPGMTYVPPHKAGVQLSSDSGTCRLPGGLQKAEVETVSLHGCEDSHRAVPESLCAGLEFDRQ